MTDETPADLRKRADRLERESAEAIRKARIKNTRGELLDPLRILIPATLLLIFLCYMFGR